MRACNMYFVMRISLPGTLPERVVAALVFACLLLCVSGEAKAAIGSYIDFGDYETQRALAAGIERGTTFKNGAALSAVTSHDAKAYFEHRGYRAADQLLRQTL